MGSSSSPSRSSRKPCEGCPERLPDFLKVGSHPAVAHLGLARAAGPQGEPDGLQCGRDDEVMKLPAAERDGEPEAGSTGQHIGGNALGELAVGGAAALH